MKLFKRQTPEEKARDKRAKACGIAVKPGGNLTKPERYSDVPDNIKDWGDYTNFKYPLVPAARAQNAITRFNDSRNKSAGGYTDSEWAKIGQRIAAKFEGKVYKNGQVVDRAVFRVFRGTDGRVYWRARSASAFYAKDEMFIATQGLAAYVEAQRGNYGPLCLFHILGLEVGECLFAHMSGRILTEFGVFIDTPMGRAAARYFLETDEELEVSIRWESDERDGNVWLDARIIERSVIPAGAAADPVTLFAIARGERMDQKHKDWIKEVLAGVGEDVIEEAIDEDRALSDELEGAGLPARNLDPPEGDEPEPEDEQEPAEGEDEDADADRQDDEPPAGEAEPAGDQVLDVVKGLLEEFSGAMMAVISNQLDGLRADLGDRLTAFEERVERIEQTAGNRQALEDAIARAMTSRASNADDTALNEGEQTEIVENQNGGFNPAWAPDPAGPSPAVTSHQQNAPGAKPAVGGMPWAPEKN